MDLQSFYPLFSPKFCMIWCPDWLRYSSINQSDIPERSAQVRQMAKIFQRSQTVLIWLGADSEAEQAKASIDSIVTISNFLYEKLEISPSDPQAPDKVFHEIVFKHRDVLPLPNECYFSSDKTWETLVWFYSHQYFTRLWVIQEINANKERWVHCAREKVEWDRVDFVAAFITMEPAFSRRYGFTSTYCWWATTVTELTSKPKDWLFMLYLASNFGCLDERDRIYGLWGLMKFTKGAELLRPDYRKSMTETYRDSVEAAFVNFENSNALLYVTGHEDPSWIPRWDRQMLFRNPFRFGKLVPWKPGGETKPTWDIDKDKNVLSLSGFIVDSIRISEVYNERYFGNAMLMSAEGRNALRRSWQRILNAVERCQSDIPFSVEVLTAAAASLSFGLDEKAEPADDRHLILNFAAYLRIVLDEDTFKRWIPPTLSEESKTADGYAFGKPVWDFEYPESSFFVTEKNLVGCTISATEPGDKLFVPLGSTYPLILRPTGDRFIVRGYAYVHGVMRGEHQGSTRRTFEIV